MTHRIYIIAFTLVVAACGGKDKSTTTVPEQPVQPEQPPIENKDPKPTPTEDNKITCETVMPHVIEVAKKEGIKPDGKDLADPAVAAEFTKIGLEQCKAQKPSEQTLKCIMKATSMKDFVGCDPNGGAKPNVKPATKPDTEEACMKDCMRRNMARAVDAKVIEMECQQTCKGANTGPTLDN